MVTVALALMVPALRGSRSGDRSGFAILAAAVVVLVILRIGYEPRIVGSDVGATPIFNWLLYGYGIPALSFWYAGYTLRARADDVPARMIESAAILFTVLLAFLEIRHLTNHGDVYSNNTGLSEIALQVSVGLAMTIGLEWVRGRTGNIVHNIGAIVVVALTLVGIVFGLCLIENPMISGRPVGGVVFNLILLGYGLPAVLAITLALVARTTRPMPYRATVAVVAVVLALLYLSLEVARAFQGETLNFRLTSNAEQYTYSAVWLAFGVVLLVIGMVLRSEPARLASATVVLLTVAKVFLVDMSALTGVCGRCRSSDWASSCWDRLLYQRLLFPARARLREIARACAPFADFAK